MIISVTGGAQTFNLKEDTRRAFKHALSKAIMMTRAWVITGGTEHGVMRLVGEVIAEKSLMSIKDLVVLGIATWGVLAEKKLLKSAKKQQANYNNNNNNNNDDDTDDNDNGDKNNYSRLTIDSFSYQKTVKYFKKSDTSKQTSKKSIYLSPNHNHFILVNDGSVNEFRKEISFRAKLEFELKEIKLSEIYRIKNKEYKEDFNFVRQIPIILIVVQGNFIILVFSR